MSLAVLPVPGLPEVRPGDDLAALIAAATDLADGDVVVVSQKVVSKAEGALVEPRAGEDPATARRRVAREQAVRVVVDTPQVLIVETPHGFVCANAGVDASNVPGDAMALLPVDPDVSAAALRTGLAERTGRDVGVVVADTFGRPWRQGQTDVAIGLAGLPAVRDERGAVDRDGVRLEVTQVALADEVAAAADLVRRKADGVPVVVVRGLAWTPDDSATAQRLVRPAEEDLFRRGRGMLARTLAGGDGDDVVLAAARCAGGHLVEVVPLPPPAVLAVRADPTDPTALLAAGAAAMAAVAALADLDRPARRRSPAKGEEGVVVVAFVVEEAR